MLKAFIAVITLLLLVTAVSASQLIYVLNLDVYSNDTVTLKSLNRSVGLTSQFLDSEAPYKVKMFSGSRELFSGNLYISFTVITDPPILDLQLEKNPLELRVPYFPEADMLKIYHNGKEIFFVRLKLEACNNNGFCDVGEDTVNCPADCPKKSKSLLLISIIFLVVLILVAVITVIAKNKLKQGKQNMGSGYAQSGSL